ncbi:MAG: heavy metal-binding protein [Dehalococcoidia bacterium]|nr:heavy metal-binding protein [Dehalococcoidia bacterium]
MTCDHCVKSVTSAVEEVHGVSSVAVDLAAQSAVIEGEALDAQAIIEAITEEGYEATVKA